MAQIQARKPQAEKIEDARELQSKLYREIGISAVAAALRFTSPMGGGSAGPVQPLPGVRDNTLAA